MNQEMQDVSEIQSTQSCQSCGRGREGQKRRPAYPKGNAMTVPMEMKRMGKGDHIDLKYLYPRDLSPLNELVMDVCDQMEYEGSMMYDQYPDRVTVDRIVSSICHHRWHDREKCQDEKLRTIVMLMLCHEMSCRRRKRHW